jgi:hypothetical protein
MKRHLTAAALALAAVAGAAAARAEDMPTFKIEMANGTIQPGRLEVPANTPFKLEITNTGSVPVEIESTDLHKEKVLIGGASSPLVFRRLPSGEYKLFDDFHPSATLILVVK